MAQDCIKCETLINGRQFLVCHSCQHNFHLDCCNVTVKRFLLMKPESKTLWKCRSCLDRPSYTSDNVTVRRRYRTIVPISNSFEALSSLSKDSEDSKDCLVSGTDLNRSCPERQCTYVIIEELQKSVSELREKLASAENEVENLLAENYSLKNKIKNYETKVCHLKSLSKSSTAKETSKRLRSKRKSANRMHLNHSYIESNADQRNAQYGLRVISSSEHNDTLIGSQISRPIHFSTPARCKSKMKKLIHIVGDEQIRGLSMRLIHSEIGAKGDYGVMATIKPRAPFFHILETLHNMSNEISRDDVIVLSVRSNEKNPYKTLAGISNVLDKFKDNCILLLNVSVILNPQLNLLYQELNLFANKYKNCKIINIYKKSNIVCNSPSFLDWLSYKLNAEIKQMSCETSYVRGDGNYCKKQTESLDVSDIIFRP